MNQNNQPQNNAARTGGLVIQPAQIQQLARQCNFEIHEARRLGTDSPAGQEHLKKAQRIKTILVQYQQQQQNRQQQAGAQAQNTQQQQQQQQPPQQQPPSQQPQPQQEQPQQNRVIPQASPSLPINNVSVAQGQSPQIAQQSPQLTQQRAISQQGNVIPQIPQQQMGQRIANAGGAVSSPSPMSQNAPTPSGAVASPNTQQPQPPKTPYQQLTQIKAVLATYTKKLKEIEAEKISGKLTPEQLQKLTEQETLFKGRFNAYKNAAVQITQQLQQKQQQQQRQGVAPQQQQQRQQPIQNAAQAGVAQGRALSNSSTPQLVQNHVANNMAGQTQIQQQQISQNMNNTNTQAQNIQFQNQSNQFNGQVHIQQQQQQHIPITSQTPAMNTTTAMPQMPQTSPAMTQQQQLIQQQQQKKAAIQQHIQQQQIPVQRSATPQQQPGQAQGNNLLNRGQPGSSASPNTPVTNVNAAAKPNGNAIGAMNIPASNVFKSSVPSLPISATVTAKPLQPAQVTQRPSLTGGQGLAAPALSTPALLKLPPYEMHSDRVLSKRKLSELVKTVGADEGDGETMIDGDVEELLLDLADEFVTNVTSFACRLAKHRKSETLDVKDVQLHLEKNWNIRIPGYSSDEIRNVRKWAPNNAHTQRIHGIGISKSVDQSK